MGGGRRALSHNLLAVLDALTAEAQKVPEYTKRPACQADLAFLESEIGLRRLLDILGDFGGRGRYSQIDGLLKGTFNPDSDPKTRWGAIETELLLERPDFEAIQTTEVVQASSEEIVARLQRMARAIARMWTLGAVGVRGRAVLRCDRDLPLPAGRRVAGHRSSSVRQQTASLSAEQREAWRRCIDPGGVRVITRRNCSLRK